MPHTVIDNVLVIAWIALFLLAAALILQLPVSDLITAGYGEYISILIHASTRIGASKGSLATLTSVCEYVC